MVHQTTSKQSADHDYAIPPITRRNTAGASERPSKLARKVSKHEEKVSKHEEKVSKHEDKLSKHDEKLSKLDFDFDWDPEDGMLGVLKKMDRLSTVGEGEDDAYPPYCDVEKSGILSEKL